ncbi:MAG: hypothetical protein CMA12_01720 [Euryarchaeota archaeon]|nr:hypothetical protein [Euryarchaeota archaeon]OUW22954.1 MAG: hypothetical protein CBD33_00295 [Euryarchaeota archaeon TMED173]|tara:strand:- start:1379 stop:1825 length:447 start_codon:yes stop_codon:yes gene_type:complete
MSGGSEGVKVDDLPAWARRFYEEYGSPNLSNLGDVFHGPLMERKFGLRRDDLVEILMDRRMLPEDRDPCLRGMMVGGRSSSIDILDELGEFRTISRDVIVEVRLISHLRRTYIEDKELIKFEKDDMKRRSEVLELAEKNSDGESNLWG